MEIWILWNVISTLPPTWIAQYIHSLNLILQIFWYKVFHSSFSIQLCEFWRFSFNSGKQYLDMIWELYIRTKQIFKKWHILLLDFWIYV